MFRNYFKIAYRNLIRHKLYGMLNITGLALSIACGILIFTLVKYHLDFDNFHHDTSRIYRFVTEQHRDNINYSASVPPALGKAFRDDYSLAEKIGRLARFDNELVSVKQGDVVKKFKEKEGVAFAEPEFFDIFNFPLLQGDKNTVLSEPNTAIITELTANKYFGKEDPVNKIIRLDDKIDCRITGVLKDIPANTDQQANVYISWATLRQYNSWLAADNSWDGISGELQCFARLRSGVSAADVEKLLPAYVEKYRAKSRNKHVYRLQPLREMHFDGRYGGVMEKRNLWILSLVALFLIVTACVNFINLATAQSITRSKEVGIRKVLGSMRWQLFWQFIAETALITLVATVAAMGFSYLALPYLNGWFHTRMTIGLLNNWQLLLFIPLLMLLVTFLAGAYPGLVLSGFRPVAALKGKLSLQSAGSFTTRRTLIVTQFTISMVLIIGMIVITRQMQYAKQSDTGFDKEAILMIPMGADTVNATVKTLKNQLADIPGVEKVSLCYAAPASEDSWSTNIRFDNRTESEPFKVSIKGADDQYLPAFGLQLVAGRNIFPADTVREFLVNETMVHKLGLLSPQDAIGKKIIFNPGTPAAAVVGVVKDFHDRSFHEDINAVAITSYAREYQNYAVRINLKNMSSVLPQLEKTWSSMNPSRIYEYHFLDDSIAAFYETEETMLRLIRVFSLVAILIGCLGLYGLVSFMVAQKTKEIGIRKVLGSSVAEILWIFGKEFTRLILVAFLVAGPVAWWLMNDWLRDFKYHISIGPWVFILAILIILVVAAVTVGYRSVRAALMNPVKSLRTE